jgi:hypothetical protein
MSGKPTSLPLLPLLPLLLLPRLLLPLLPPLLPLLAPSLLLLSLQERRHHGPWRLVHGDASQLSTWAHAGRLLPKQHSLSGSHAFVLMMEVMDNLPHDRWE